MEKTKLARRSHQLNHCQLCWFCAQFWWLMVLNNSTLMTLIIIDISPKGMCTPQYTLLLDTFCGIFRLCNLQFSVSNMKSDALLIWIDKQIFMTKTINSPKCSLNLLLPRFTPFDALDVKSLTSFVYIKVLPYKATLVEMSLLLSSMLLTDVITFCNYYSPIFSFCAKSIYSSLWEKTKIHLLALFCQDFYAIGIKARNRPVARPTKSPKVDYIINDNSLRADESGRPVRPNVSLNYLNIPSKYH